MLVTKQIPGYVYFMTYMFNMDMRGYVYNAVRFYLIID